MERALSYLVLYQLQRDGTELKTELKKREGGRDSLRVLASLTGCHRPVLGSETD